MSTDARGHTVEIVTRFDPLDVALYVAGPAAPDGRRKLLVVEEMSWRPIDEAYGRWEPTLRIPGDYLEPFRDATAEWRQRMRYDEPQGEIAVLDMRVSSLEDERDWWRDLARDLLTHPTIVQDVVERKGRGPF